MLISRSLCRLRTSSQFPVEVQSLLVESSVVSSMSTILSRSSESKRPVTQSAQASRCSRRLLTKVRPVTTSVLFSEVLTRRKLSRDRSLQSQRQSHRTQSSSEQSMSSQRKRVAATAHSLLVTDRSSTSGQPTSPVQSASQRVSTWSCLVITPTSSSS